MAHKKKKKYDDSDNSRKAYRWRKRNNCMTKKDMEREEQAGNVQHGARMEALLKSGEIKTKIKMSKLIAKGKK